jgi:hypothetical protein
MISIESNLRECETCKSIVRRDQINGVCKLCGRRTCIDCKRVCDRCGQIFCTYHVKTKELWSQGTLSRIALCESARYLPFKIANLDRTKTALLVKLEPYRTNPVLKEIFYYNASSLDLNKRALAGTVRLLSTDSVKQTFWLHPIGPNPADSLEWNIPRYYTSEEQ